MNSTFSRVFLRVRVIFSCTPSGKLQFSLFYVYDTRYDIWENMKMFCDSWWRFYVQKWKNKISLFEKIEFNVFQVIITHMYRKINFCFLTNIKYLPIKKFDTFLVDSSNLAKLRHFLSNFYQTGSVWLFTLKICNRSKFLIQRLKKLRNFETASEQINKCSWK